jgi:SpoVK/Ycf46/Vps4 family AAA+-type ATPase
MIRTRSLAELFRAIAAEDMTAATSIATRLCELEEKKGHRGVARQLRGALSAAPNGHQPNGHSSPSVPSATFFTALTRLQETPSFDQISLASASKTELHKIIAEWKNRDRLSALGIAPRSKLLFYGPPGCGKSMTAKAFGHELDLPVYLVRFDAVIGAFLGQTAINLRQLFHFAETTPCILLLDELDALGKRRGNPLDVGELDRIVISLLQELEHSRPAGIVVATTNRARHLDDALWRRFDLSIPFAAPTRAALRTFAKRVAAEKHIPISRKVVGSAANAGSFAAAEQCVLAEARRLALESTIGEK